MLSGLVLLVQCLCSTCTRPSSPARLQYTVRCLQQRVSPGVQRDSDCVRGQMREGSVTLATEELGHQLSLGRVSRLACIQDSLSLLGLVSGAIRKRYTAVQRPPEVARLEGRRAAREKDARACVHHQSWLWLRLRLRLRLRGGCAALRRRAEL